MEDLNRYNIIKGIIERGFKVGSSYSYYTFTFFLLFFCHSMLAQTIDEKLFLQFENHFIFLDSLIFKQQVLQTSSNVKIESAPTSTIHDTVDSLLYTKVEKQIHAMKAENGLLISGQSYYRLDDGIGFEEDDALSRYKAKVQVELRWNFLSSSFINRKSRIKELEIKGELERVKLEGERIEELVEKQKKYFHEEYDSLLASVLQLRINNLKLLSEAQQYLVSDRSISTDELLKIMDEQAIAERQLVTIPKNYPLASQLVYPHGAIIKIDTANLKKYIAENDLKLYTSDLQIELLEQQEKSTTYWRTLNLSPFIRYSYYVRPEIRSSSNVDAGIAFQIPLSVQEPRKRKALKAERLQKVMEKEVLIELITKKVELLFIEIDRANRGLEGELERIKKMRDYMKLRRENYQAHIGEYNFFSRIKEYNHYLTCWENFYTYQYKRDCCIAELQNYLPEYSVLKFCTIVEKK
jgi:DNA-directed RNA polymerase subunit H (RpoH/RPB5)